MYKEYDVAIIGNGFDLYYGQPTRYEDFYNFMKEINVLKKEDIIDKYQNCNIEKHYDYLKNCLDSNLFLIYFIKYNQIYDSWKAFEDELLFLLKLFNELLENIEKSNYNFSNFCEGKIEININKNAKYFDVIEMIGKCKLFEYASTKTPYGTIFKIFIKCDLDLNSNKKIVQFIKNYIDNFPEELYLELDEFCKVFKIYLKLFLKDVIHKDFDKNIYVNKIVNYNYTDIAKKLFVIEDEICYIHGNVDRQIVLGVDSKHSELQRFFYFTKEMQKIEKDTDFNKLDYIAGYANSLIVVGHSLNEADDESLKILFCKEDYYDICVYYYAKDRFSKIKLANNMKRILGPKRFTRFTNSGILRFEPLPE